MTQSTQVCFISDPRRCPRLFMYYDSCVNKRTINTDNTIHDTDNLTVLFQYSIRRS